MITTGFIALIVTTIAASWRTYTYMKYTNPETWFTSAAWMMNTFSVYGGLIGVLVLWIVLVKITDLEKVTPQTKAKQVKAKPLKQSVSSVKEKPTMKEIPKNQPETSKQPIKQPKLPTGKKPIPMPPTPAVQNSQQVIIKQKGNGCVTCVIWIVGFIIALVALKFLLVAMFGHAILDSFNQLMR